MIDVFATKTEREHFCSSCGIMGVHFVIFYFLICCAVVDNIPDVGCQLFYFLMESVQFNMIYIQVLCPAIIHIHTYCIQFRYVEIILSRKTAIK